MKQTCWKWYPV